MIMKYVGVDGCRAGWLCAAMGRTGMEIAVFRSFSEIWVAHSDAEVILVDIPIGLPGGKHLSRSADRLARKMLGRRHSTVFSPGARKTLHSRSYAEACGINRKVTDKKISLQYWNVMPKVKEVDSFLHSTPEAIGIVKEAHPEICFEKASGNSMCYGKKTSEGILERIEILKEYYPNSQRVYSQVLKSHLRRDVARDDIVDAMILAVTALEGKGKLRSMPDPLEMDEKNLPMAIWYHDFKR